MKFTFSVENACSLLVENTILELTIWAAGIIENMYLIIVSECGSFAIAHSTEYMCYSWDVRIDYV